MPHLSLSLLGPFQATLDLRPITDFKSIKVRALLATERDIEVIGEAGDGAAAVAQAQALCPDVILMDLMMPVMDGIEATRRIKARWPQIKIMALSMYGDSEAEALIAGADAFVSKGESPEKLLETLGHLSKRHIDEHPHQRSATRRQSDHRRID